MKVAMWISKEKMLPAQEKLLKDAGYNIIIYNKGIYNVEDFLDEIKNLNKEIYERVLLIPVVPESVKIKLLEEIRNRNLKFEVVEPIMKELGRYDNEVLCKMLLSQNLDSRVVVKLKDGTSDFLPALEGRGFPPRGFIVPTIGSGLHPSFGEQSSGSENHSHLKGGLSSLSSSPLKERDTGCSSHSPIKPSIELGRSVVSVTKRCLEKEIFKLSIRGLSIPALKGEAFRPLNPQLCKVYEFVEFKHLVEYIKRYDEGWSL